MGENKSITGSYLYLFTKLFVCQILETTLDISSVIKGKELQQLDKVTYNKIFNEYKVLELLWLLSKYRTNILVSLLYKKIETVFCTNTFVLVD